jgi:hypothetical protein
MKAVMLKETPFSSLSDLIVALGCGQMEGEPGHAI